MLALGRLSANFQSLRISVRNKALLQQCTSVISTRRGISEANDDLHMMETTNHMIQVSKRKTPDPVNLTGVRHKMRGRFNITKTKWWLEQGPVLIDQVAAINLEYNKPASDEYGFSRGAYNYHHYYIPQLRYKNPNIQIDVSTDQVAVPYMTLHFKDGRQATVNCASSAEEIAKHLQGTFCIEHVVKQDEEFDDTGRIRNPWMHGNTKPCSTATKYRCHRKCMCQQPGQYGCKMNMHHLMQMPERKALTQRSSHNLPVEDNWYVNFLDYEEVCENPRGTFNKHRYYRRGHNEKRPWRGPEFYRNYQEETKRIEAQQARRIVRKMKGHSDFKLIKRLSHKMVHEYWCTWFWQCEPGLGPNMDEVKKQLKLRSIYLSKREHMRGGHGQLRSRDRFGPGIPYYS